MITHFSSSSDLLCCSALARAKTPVAVRPLALRLQWGMQTWVRSTLPFSRKIWQGFKFGGLAVSVETAKLKSANIILAPRARHARNFYIDVIHSEAPPPNLNFANIFYARFGAKLPNLMTANISGYTVCFMLLWYINDHSSPPKEPMILVWDLMRPKIQLMSWHCCFDSNRPWIWWDESCWAHSYITANSGCWHHNHFISQPFIYT